MDLTAVVLLLAGAALAVAVAALVVALLARSTALTAAYAVNELLHEIVAPGASGRGSDDDQPDPMRTLSD